MDQIVLSRPQIEQTIGDVIYDLVKAVSESNDASSTHIQTQKSYPLLRFACWLGKDQLLLTKNDKLQLRVQVFYDMIHSYNVYYYGSEDDLRQLTFADLRKSLKDKLKYSYVFTDGDKLQKDRDLMWKPDNKNFTFIIEIAKFWLNITYRDQDQLVSCLKGVGYDKIKLIQVQIQESERISIL